MAARKRASLSVVLNDDDTTTPAEAGDVDQAQATAETTSETTAPATPAKKATRSPRKKEAAAPAKKTSPRQPAAKKAAATKAPAKPAPEPIRVKASDAKTAKKVSLYLHPDDFRELGMAKLDDGVDANSRIRAMIALWRENPRMRAQVDKLAKTAPRGGML
ncbi:hypothetical protein ACFWO6_30590 [Paenibacillus glucanolyticus]|uniref:hypothetical protein n=1 Tax=Paenibacillus glucanolyticus TaxID=59843 RepID=UPI003647AD6E